MHAETEDCGWSPARPCIYIYIYPLLLFKRLIDVQGFGAFVYVFIWMLGPLGSVVPFGTFWALGPVGLFG